MKSLMDPGQRRKWSLAVADAILLVLAGLLAFLLRFDGGIPWSYFRIYMPVGLALLPVRLLVLFATGMYSIVWRHAGTREYVSLMAVASLGSALLAAAVFLIRPSAFPRSIPVLEGIVWGLLMIMLRLYGRPLLERLKGRNKVPRGASRRFRTVIVGAGDAGGAIVTEILGNPRLPYHPVGFLDDDPAKSRCSVKGVKVLGTVGDLAEIAMITQAERVLVAVPSNTSVVRRVFEQAHPLGLEVRTLPSLGDLIGGSVTTSRMRKVRIEDLLHRHEFTIDEKAIAEYLRGKSVLITGAGGSIGSELARQVSRFQPRQLIMIDHSEGSLFEIDWELKGRLPDAASIIPLIGSITNEQRMKDVLSQYKVDVIFHAAAYKHVPLMENNPVEAIRVNFLATRRLGEIALERAVDRFVLVSTDKAVHPSSVMGATKRLAELAMIDLQQVSTSTRFVTVRFGNVLDSRGSVFPIFLRQIECGGPVTVTHPDATRFFMTIPEAARLITQAGSMGTGGDIFVLDMGEPIPILELAKDVIRLSGFEPNTEIAIEFTGLRPGEKLTEELFYEEERPVATGHPLILRVDSDPLRASASGALAEVLGIIETAASNDEEKVKQMLRGFVEGDS